MSTPRGLRARGRSAVNTSNGVTTVRDQYDTLSRWNGNHRGRCTISMGITGTARHGTWPKSARAMRVKTLHFAAPPKCSTHARAPAMCGASTGSPASLSARYALTVALTSLAPP